MILYLNIIVEKNLGLEIKDMKKTRIIFVDFAGTDSSGKEGNDNTVIGCMCGYPNKQRTRIIRDLEYMETQSGGKKEETEKEYENYSSFMTQMYLYMIIGNIGEDRYIDLSKPYFHEELGIQMEWFWNI